MCGQVYHPVVVSSNPSFSKQNLPVYADLAGGRSVRPLALHFVVLLPK